jgi:3-isopropylmalate dehydratase small subunit
LGVGIVWHAGQQRVTLPDGDSLAFEIDPFARTMILTGTDEIGYVRWSCAATRRAN